MLLGHAIESVGARLWLTAWAGNVQALAFYRAYGFVDIGTAWHEFEDQKYESRVLAYQKP